MDLAFLSEFTVPVIVGICLCVGFVIKQSITFIPNKYIPLIMAGLGLLISVGTHRGISETIVLQGLFSGLVSTGLYEAFRGIIKGEQK